MGERKVINKYYPADFDPSKIPRSKQPKNQQMIVRMMLPMSVRCVTCANYMYKGTKFNMRKENAVGEAYLGIQIIRFYFKCSKCCAELAMKTDPQNSDYIVESGATRNFEPWRDQEKRIGEAKRKRDDEETGDKMKALENRALDSKREMEGIAALKEMISMKSRHASVSVDGMLEAMRREGVVRERKTMDDQEDEALIRSIFDKSKEYVRRIDEDEDDDDEGSERMKVIGVPSERKHIFRPKRLRCANMVVEKKPIGRVVKVLAAKQHEKRDKNSVGLHLLSQYEDNE